MSDVSIKTPIRVSTDGNAGPYIMVSLQQLKEVRALLDEHRIPYWVDEAAISLDGRPAITVVNLGRSANPKRVQEILTKHVSNN